MVSRHELAALLHAEGFDLDDRVLASLSGYLDLLMRFNRSMNLVGVQTWQDAVSSLVLDSLHLSRLLPNLPLSSNPVCWDPGAGAGLPGIPLRMVWNPGVYWLIEPRQKRALFLSTVLARHPLPGTKVFRGRLEAFAASPQGQGGAELIVSRAFMPWRDLLSIAPGFLRPHGFLVLMLNASGGKELEKELVRWKMWSRYSTLDYIADSNARIIYSLLYSPL